MNLFWCQATAVTNSHSYAKFRKYKEDPLRPTQVNRNWWENENSEKRKWRNGVRSLTHQMITREDEKILKIQKQESKWKWGDLKRCTFTISGMERKVKKMGFPYWTHVLTSGLSSQWKDPSTIWFLLDSHFWRRRAGELLTWSIWAGFDWLKSPCNFLNAEVKSGRNCMVGAHLPENNKAAQK